LKIGKKAARRHFKASVKTKADWERTIVAHNAYLDYVKAEHKKGFKVGIKHGSTFFNSWEDWV